jgi:hypothetical protein
MVNCSGDGRKVDMVGGREFIYTSRTPALSKVCLQG